MLDDSNLVQFPDVDLSQIENELKIEITDTEFVQTEAAAGTQFTPTGCWAGIDRWKGASNK